MPKLILVFVLFCISTNLFAQHDFPFKIEVRESSLKFPAVHSFATAVQGDKWLIIGGRSEGIHARQPFRSFDPEYANRNIYLIDAKNGRISFASVEKLKSPLSDQLKSSNTNTTQSGGYLFISGGYGFSTLHKDFITYPYLTVVDIDRLITAIEKQEDISPCFTQIEHEKFAVTGGHLALIRDTFYLVGGQKFTGRYNPMGHDTYVQEYHTGYRRFTLNKENMIPKIAMMEDNKYAMDMRRRDFNLLPEIDGKGHAFLTVSSGVFQPDEDLPYLYPVRIDHPKVQAQPNFNQYLSNYHCAVSSIRRGGITNHIFFGGISRFYFEGSTLMQDDNVPFVKTISLLQSKDSGYTEYKMPAEMPGYLGANAAFIPAANMPLLPNGIIDLDKAVENDILIGYLAGGILSQEENVFNNNETEKSSASPKVYEVWLKKDSETKAISVNGENPCSAKLQRLDKDKAIIEIISNRERKAKLLLYSNNKYIDAISLGSVKLGSTIKELNLSNCRLPENATIEMQVVLDGKFFMPIPPAEILR